MLFQDHHSKCYKCKPGTYQEKEGETGCTPCRKGYYQTEEGAEMCTKCPAGYTTDNPGSKSKDQCYGNYHHCICKECLFPRYIITAQYVLVLNHPKVLLQVVPEAKIMWTLSSAKISTSIYNNSLNKQICGKSGMLASLNTKTYVANEKISSKALTFIQKLYYTFLYSSHPTTMRDFSNGVLHYIHAV